ncbi:MAG: hypothetical protein ABJF10_09765 [Chthoniobacter sp.]|uniref:hypothetical protein n=1 Tax=Chthoniobacter sp. TaxID=2510640 RepID=UPI0032AD99A6
MKSLVLATFSFLLAATAFAEPPQVQIAIRYEGFDGARYAEIRELAKGGKPDLLYAAQNVVTNSGQHVKVESVPDIEVPETPDGEKRVNLVAVDFLPVIQNDGQIALSGKSVLRRPLPQNATQPLVSLSFATHETFFSGTVQNGKELIIAVGDGPRDKARIILTVRIVTFAVPAPAK